MSSGTIHFAQMVKAIDAADYKSSESTFSIVYDQCDRKRKTGGNRLAIVKAQKCGLPFNVQSNEMRGIVDLSTGKKTAVHLRLIFEFNNQTVYW